MKRTLITATYLVLSLGLSSQVSAGAVDTLQQQYKEQGAGPFSSAAGQKAWQQKHLDAKTGKQRDCQTCHGSNLKLGGKHIRTGKLIEPLAPSANNERLTDIKFINKWFKRNCKWTLGRECSAQEKGDFLEYLKGL